MRWFGEASRHDREQVLTTLHSLGSTSVPGLAAALSWPERRTQRVLEDALRDGSQPVRYDPVTRAVRWLAPPARPATPAPPTVPGPSRPEPTTPQLPTAWGAKARCPSCQSALQPTGTGAGYVCPRCGRLTSLPGGRATEAPPPPLPRGPPAADRRSQELFAAWVTAQPIPCPRCRTTLRHRGVAEYVCPGCGEQVRFERTHGAAAAGGTVPKEAALSAPDAPHPPPVPAR